MISPFEDRDPERGFPLPVEDTRDGRESSVKNLTGDQAIEACALFQRICSEIMKQMSCSSQPKDFRDRSRFSLAGRASVSYPAICRKLKCIPGDMRNCEDLDPARARFGYHLGARSIQAAMRAVPPPTAG